MSLLKYIETILTPHCIRVTTSGMFQMTEGNPDAVCKSVPTQISGEVVGCHFSCKMNFGGTEIDIFPYFNDVTHVKKMCDYIFFYKHRLDDAKLYVVLCELKGAAGGYLMQMRAGCSFARHIIDAAKRNAMCDNHKCKEDIEYVGAAFLPNPSYKLTSPKQSLFQEPIDLHTTINIWEVECNGHEPHRFKFSDYTR